MFGRQDRGETHGRASQLHSSASQKSKTLTAKAAKKLREERKGHKCSTLILRTLRPSADGLRTLRLKRTYETVSLCLQSVSVSD